MARGEVLLGSDKFVIDPYDFCKFDGGFDLVIVWVNITVYLQIYGRRKSLGI
jgi:hypothetical protein